MTFLFSILVTYQTKDNKLKHRLVKYVNYEIGYKNRYGWVVVEVLRFYENKFYTLKTYEYLKETNRKATAKIREVDRVLDELETMPSYIYKSKVRNGFYF